MNNYVHTDVEVLKGFTILEYFHSDIGKSHNEPRRNNSAKKMRTRAPGAVVTSVIIGWQKLRLCTFALGVGN